MVNRGFRTTPGAVPAAGMAAWVTAELDGLNGRQEAPRVRPVFPSRRDRTGAGRRRSAAVASAAAGLCRHPLDAVILLAMPIGSSVGTRPCTTSCCQIAG